MCRQLKDIIYIHTHASTSFLHQSYFWLSLDLFVGVITALFLTLCLCSEGLVDMQSLCGVALLVNGLPVCQSAHLCSPHPPTCSLEAHEDSALEILVVCVRACVRVCVCVFSG